MVVAVAREIKDNENRVGLTPAGAQALKLAGHRVLAETNCGVGSGFSDEQYIKAGAEIFTNKQAMFDAADMIVKVKEPLAPEYDMFHEGQILYTYLHLAPEPELTKALLKKKVVGFAYETITGRDGGLPLLKPMSEVAGRMSVQIGANFLLKANGGMGILLGGVPGVPPAEVVIIGGGIVGLNAAKMAVGLGAHVTLMDSNPDRMREIDDIFFGGRVTTVMSNSYNIAEWVKKADLVVGAVLVPGAKAPKLVTEEMVKTMKPGSVIVDVAIDQGGSVETIDRITTHSNPTYTKYGVEHYAVANMPGAVPRTSTLALTNSTLAYCLKIANMGWKDAVRNDAHLAAGINVCDGKVTYKAVADELGYDFTPLADLLD